MRMLQKKYIGIVLLLLVAVSASAQKAERDYIRVELFEPVASKENTFKARKFRVAVAVDSCAGAGGEAVKVTGNLNNVGTFVDGEFNTQTKTFTEAGAELTAKTFAKTEAVTTKA